MMRLFAPTAPRFAAAKQLERCGIITDFGVKPVSKWTWKFCEQFVDIKYDPTLSLPTGIDLCDSAKVFAELSINDEFLIKPPRGERVYEHCKIEAVMERKGYTTTDPRSHYMCMQNMLIVRCLADVRQQELSSNRYFKKMDRLADIFFRLSDFDKEPFDIKARGSDFNIFGKTCSKNDAFYVSTTPENDFLIMFGDQSLAPDEVVKREGHLGEIVGGLLQFLVLNRANNIFRSVFAIRFVDYYVTAFRLDADESTLNTLVKTNKAPKKKLLLLCSDISPTKHRGLSLIDKNERLKALQLMADMLNFILNVKT